MAPLVGKYEQLINGVWVDLSSRASWGDAGSPVEISRGLNDDGSPLAGTMTVTLENSDGALTPGGPGPWGPHLVRWRPARVSVLVDGVWRQRFYGFVDSEPLSWPTGKASYCVVTVTAIDVMARAAAKQLRSTAVESLAMLDPLAYWPLTDTGGESGSDESRYSRSDLAVQHRGDLGEIGWGSGHVLPTDGSGGLTLTPDAASDKGYFLRSTVGIDLPSAWCLSIHGLAASEGGFLVLPADKSGWLVQVGNETVRYGLWYDKTSGELSLIETTFDGSGTVVELVRGSTLGLSSPMLLKVTSGSVQLGRMDPDGPYWLASATRSIWGAMPDSLVSVGGPISDTSRARLFSGEIKHVAIWPTAIPPADLYARTMVGLPALSTMQGTVETALAWAGQASTVVTRGTNRPTVLPAPAGKSAGALIGDLAQGSLARIAADATGQVVVTAWDYQAPAIVAPAGEIDPEIEWAGDPDGDVTQATMTWPDGSTYAITDSESHPVDLPGVLPVALGQSVTEWTVRADTGAPRIPSASYDLVTLPVADMVTLCGVEVGDLLTTPDLPGQLPSQTQTAIVDSIAETIAVDQWSIRFATSPDLRDRLFVVGDPVRGMVGAGYTTAPLGPTGGLAGSWTAGEEIDAARLNGRQRASGGLSQAGAVAEIDGLGSPIDVTFPRPFAAAPKVVASLTLWGIGITDGNERVTVRNVTATGFDIYPYFPGSLQRGAVAWVAVV